MEDEIRPRLVEHFEGAGSAPFLFIGSGFSRRYLGLEDWDSLLRRFATGLRPYEYYYGAANGDLPTVASLIAEDFHDLWWDGEDYSASRERNRSLIRDRTSPMRIEIAQYLDNIVERGFAESEHADEIAILSRLNVDGIITTNWDNFIERLYPDYKVYVGQEELLFSHPQSIGEIYKIHGSSARPATMVLTRRDYDQFEARNPYLAAKIITIFVEHPVVFLGYSLTDPNISALLRAIVVCLGGENVDKLRRNLIFIERAMGEDPQVSHTLITIDGAQLPVTIVRTDDYRPVYEALDATKRQIPARVLRFCKEQLYELVKSQAPESKIAVVNIDEMEKYQDVEFVVGIGVADRETAAIGYQGLGAVDLFRNVMFPNNRNLDSRRVVEEVIPAISKTCTYLPVYKYLLDIGVTSREQYEALGIDLDRHTDRNPASFSTTTFARQYVKSQRDKSIQELIATNPPEKVAIFLPFVPRERFDLDQVHAFLSAHIDKVDYQQSSSASYFRKAVCIYDYYRYGWDDL